MLPGHVRLVQADGRDVEAQQDSALHVSALLVPLRVQLHLQAGVDIISGTNFVLIFSIFLSIVLFHSGLTILTSATGRSLTAWPGCSSCTGPPASPRWSRRGWWLPSTTRSSLASPLTPAGWRTSANGSWWRLSETESLLWS